MDGISVSSAESVTSARTVERKSLAQQVMAINDSDPVSEPQHYTARSKECIDEMVLIFGVEAVKAFCKCNAWKYRYRAPYKGTPEIDLRKADKYIQFYEDLEQYEKIQFHK